METGSQEFIQMVVKDLEDHFNDDPNQILSMSSPMSTGSNRENSLLGRTQTRNSSQAIVFTQGPIMEDDDLDNGEKNSDNDSGDDYEGSEVITGDNISDSEQVMLRSAQSNRNRLIVPNQPGYIAMKPGIQSQCVGLGDIVYGQNTMGHIILQEGVDNEMIVEEKVEVGDENHDTADVPHDEIILVSNSLLKHEIIESGEVIVGTNMHPQNVGNEIVIGEHLTGRHHSSMQLTDIEDDGTFDSNLIIDTSAIKDEGVGSSIGYDCGECGSVLKSRGALKKHISKHHGPVGPEMMDVPNRIYSCSSCTYQTARRDKLDKHISKHIAEGFSPSGKKRNKATPPQRMRHAAEEYKCPLCPYRCTVEKAFKKHMKLHQAGTKHFVVKVSCKICGKDRSSETDLRKHMKKHKDDKDFVCDVCGFASIQLKKIIQHRRMHTGEKPHLCPHCSYRSARRDNLRSHVRRMHKKENMYIDTFNPRTDVAPE